jgi:hypothetical protein
MQAQVEAALPDGHSGTDHDGVPPSVAGAMAVMEGASSDDQVRVRDRLPVRREAQVLEWVRSMADTLQAPGELRRLASYDNVFSATPHRVVEFTFDSLEDAARYFGRKEISFIFQSELPAHGTNIGIKCWHSGAITPRTPGLRTPLPGRISPKDPASRLTLRSLRPHPRHWLLPCLHDVAARQRQGHPRVPGPGTPGDLEPRRQPPGEHRLGRPQRR